MFLRTCSLRTKLLSASPRIFFYRTRKISITFNTDVTVRVPLELFSKPIWRLPIVSITKQLPRMEPRLSETKLGCFIDHQDHDYHSSNSLSNSKVEERHFRCLWIYPEAQGAHTGHLRTFAVCSFLPKKLKRRPGSRGV